MPPPRARQMEGDLRKVLDSHVDKRCFISPEMTEEDRANKAPV